MGELGRVGAVRGGGKQRPADTGQKERRAPDLVDRQFSRFRPDQLWVADFTRVWTWAGWVHVAFVFDAASRRILGCAVAASMATPLVLDWLERALRTRRREDIESFGARPTTPMQAASIRRSRSPTDSSTKASTQVPALSATPTKTPSPKARRSDTRAN